MAETTLSQIMELKQKSLGALREKCAEIFSLVIERIKWISAKKDSMEASVKKAINISNESIKGYFR